MWKHSEKYSPDSVTVHDCYVTHAYIKDKNLYFDFDDGFWVVAKTAHNPSDKTLRTGKSQVCFINIDLGGCCFYIFKNHRLFTLRKEITLEQLTDSINSNKFRLELCYEYTSYQKFLFEGFTHGKRDSNECQLLLYCDDMLCCWDDLRTECTW